MGKLSVVATPIGNLEDMTFSAVRVLKECDYILCKDTRVTGKLLKHYKIDSKMKRYDAHASEKVHKEILEDLGEGKHIALVSDAGTPGVSDPGVLLIQKIRTYGHPMSIIVVEAIPGPSAVTAAFSIAGLSGNRFTFLGFVPHKKGRQTFFKDLASYKHPVIFFESVHRIMKTLQSLVDLNQSNASVNRGINVIVIREITKLHEEVVSGTPEEIKQYFEDNNDHQKGEFVVIVESQKPKD